MIKNLNDLISLLVLILMMIFSLRIFAWTFFRKERINVSTNRWQLFIDYIDNEEE